MALKEQLKQDLFKAMKSHDKETADILRLAISAIKNEEINQGKELDDAGVITVLQKEVKKVKDAIADYQKLGRDDLIKIEKIQLSVLEKYVPELLSADEIRKVVTKVIETINPVGMKDFGLVMGNAMKELKGKADGAEVSKVVKEELQKIS